MLKNKFSVLKSVALVMVLLMTVAVFAACGKETNDDSAAISSALEALQSSLNAQASQNATQSSAFEDSQEEQNKLISSMLAEQAKELEEQAKKQSEALAAAAASQSKALAEQSKKLSEQLANDAKKQSSILAAAAASQSKELAEQSKKQSSILAEQSKQQSSILDEATKTSETTTTAPIVVEDITAQVAELSSLKLKYVVTMANYYIGDNYAKITNLFDVASLQMNNAKTVAAAEDILAQVKVDAEAIPNAQNVANAFKAQVDALGDIETEVFTTSAAKVTAARKALKAFEEDYAAFKKADANWDKTLGIRTQKNELEKAEAKIKALASYMTKELTADMRKMYEDSGKRIKTPNNFNGDWKELVSGAYYKYQVLSIVNGGDVSDADLPIDWEYKYDEEGNIVKDENGKVHDLDKPIAFFTTEQMMDVYVLPWADEEFEDAKDGWIEELKLLIEDTAIVKVVKDYIPAISLKVANVTLDKAALFAQAEADIEDYFDDFEDELKALSYAADYKASGTLDDAKLDLFQRAVKAYAAALADVAPAFQVAADELINDKTESAIDGLSDEDKNYANKLENLNVQLTNAQAKVDAITSYALDEISTEAVRVAYAKFIGNKTAEDIKKVPALNELLDDAANWADVKVYLEKVAAMGIANAIKGVSGDLTFDEASLELVDLVEWMINDLTDFKDRFLDADRADEKETVNGIKVNFSQYNTYRGDASYNIITEETTYKNAAKLAALKADVEKAIADLSAIKSSDYADKEVTMTNPTNKTKYGPGKTETAEKAPLYFQSEAAKQFAIDKDLTGKQLFDTADYRYQLLTATKTDWPVTYTYTAAEQAMMVASNLYKDIYAKAVNTLFACDKTKYITGSEITSDKKFGSFKKVNASNAALTTEINTLVNYYVGEINKAIDGKAYVNQNNKLNVADHITVTKDENKKASSTEIPADITTKFKESTALVTKCLATEIPAKGDDGEILKDDQGNTIMVRNDNNVYLLRDLWTLKVNTAAEVRAAVAEAKNSYKMVASATGTASTDIKVISKWNSWFLYDNMVKDEDKSSLKDTALLNAKIEPSAKAAEYEAELDALVEKYVSNIMAVTMDDAQKEVKDWSSSITIFEKSKLARNYKNAEKLVEAYKTDILGSGAVKTVKVKGSEIVIKTAKNVDSRVFSKWFNYFGDAAYLYDTKVIE